MKVRLLFVSALLAGFGLFGTAAPAQAGLWCENVDTIDQSTETGGLAGTACRKAIGAACSVISKIGGGGGGCLD